MSAWHERLSMAAVASAFLLIVCSLAGASVGAYVYHEAAAEETTLVVEAQISKGFYFRAYYNNEWQSPQRQSVVAGQWHRYSFDVPHTITSLRLDPSDEGGATIQIRSVSLQSAQETVQIPLPDMTRWIAEGMRITYDQAGGMVRIETLKPAAYTMSTVDVRWTKAGGTFGALRFDDAHLLYLCLVGALVFALCCVNADNWRSAAGAGITAAVGLFLARKAALFVLHHFGAAPAATDSVGADTYSNFAKSAELSAMAVAAFTIALVGILAGVLVRKRRDQITLDSIQRPISWLFPAIALGVFALLSFPDLSAVCASLAGVHHRGDFDSQAVVSWQYFEWKGLLPMRDYWFPYSGLYDKLGPLRLDLLRDYVHCCLILAVLVFSLQSLFNRKWIWPLVCILLFVQLENGGVLSPNGTWRYFLTLSAVLLWASSLKEKRWWLSVLSGAWTCYVVAEEISQGIYAAGPMLILGVAAVIAEKDKILWLRRFGLACAAFGVCFAGYLVSLAAHSQIREWWNFVLMLGKTTAFSGWPANLADWFTATPNLDRAVIWASLLLLLFGGFVAARRPGAEGIVVRFTPLALGLLTALILQKDVLRPSIVRQFMVIPLLGVVFLLYRCAPVNVPRRARIWAAFLAGFAGTVYGVTNGKWHDLGSGTISRLERIGTNVTYASGHLDDWRRAEAGFFSAPAFQLAGVGGDLWQSELQQRLGWRPEDGMFVLGDDPELYLILKRPAPFYIELYDQSPIERQENTVAWLDRKRPKYVLWNSNFKEFDAVPNPVRSPVIYSYVARHYVPQTNIFGFQVLRRREASDPADPVFWQTMLGSSVDLGYVPSLTEFTTTPKRANTGTGLANVVEVQIGNPQPGRTRQVTLLLGNQPYTVGFKERAKVSSYYIRLDRLPVVEAASEAGVTPALGPTASDARITLRQMHTSKEDLY